MKVATAATTTTAAEKFDFASVKTIESDMKEGGHFFKQMIHCGIIRFELNSTDTEIELK